MMIDIQEAVRRVRHGEVIGFPTETVYGLGCDPRNEAAVQRIYELKGRAEEKPLSLHISSIEQAKSYVEAWPPRAVLLAEAFWPGPLTLILPRSSGLRPFVTSGQPTVGLRCPQHALLLRFLDLLGFPLAGTSANRSGEAPATSAAEARAIFPDLAVLDGGACPIGEASTVLDLSGDEVRVLRKGSLALEAIAHVLGDDTALEPH